MSIFEYEKNEVFGSVESVDTATVVVRIVNDEKLKELKVNNLVVLRSTKVGQHLIGLVTKIMRKSGLEPIDEDAPEEGYIIENVVRITLIGTHMDKFGTKDNVFRRTLETVPELNAECFVLKGEKLTNFMRAISQLSMNTENPLSLGRYTLDEEAEAWIDGNKFFQRHAIVVGSTGSGKSWTIARILEQVSKLKSANSIVFDIHGEYQPITGEGFHHLKVAGPNDTFQDNIIFLPYWLLTYEEMISMMLDRSDNNAPNQAMVFSNEVISAKRNKLEELGKQKILDNFTIDSPVPYNLDIVVDRFNLLDREMITGSSGRDKQGPFHGKLTRFIQRLVAKRDDKRLNFLFNREESLMSYDLMEDLCRKLMWSSSLNDMKGIKIIDFSEVPSDILPLIIGLVARVIFSVQQWVDKDKRHPIAIFCDEAHLYIPAKTEHSIDEAGLKNFERIAKEGRKYGVSLIVISQRPAEVSRTVLSQSCNFVAMRLTNAEDQSVIKRLLPDSLGDFAELLPILDIGEAVVIGDASLLPSRIRISVPTMKPSSATVDFWDEWSKTETQDGISKAVESLRKQSKH